MTLDKLRIYHRLREYQISHLLNAQQSHKVGKVFEQQTFLYLFYWADAMHEADAMMWKLATSNVVVKSRGKA